MNTSSVIICKYAAAHGVAVTVTMNSLRCSVKVTFVGKTFVTGFAKRGLVCTQFQVSLFTATRQIQQD